MGEISTPTYQTETIAAITSGVGKAAVGMIRISGPATLPVLIQFIKKPNGFDLQEKHFKSRPRQMILSKFYFEDEFIDECLVCFFPNPNSYTGEDCAELYAHGNPLILKQLLFALISSHQVRLANPGEFTHRAFLAGKMDLTQAEAVKRIIDAKSEYELRAGRRNLAGELTRMVNRFKSKLLGLVAETEAELDFSTEDLTFETREARKLTINGLLEEIRRILEYNKATQNITNGFQIVLAGIPNSGKSSLLNKILGWDRSIVSPEAGTTRDYIAETIELNGVTVRIVDTAGLRETQNTIEEEGVRRSLKEIQNSTLVLYLEDGSVPRYKAPSLPEGRQVVHIINKSDELDKSRIGVASDESSGVFGGFQILISCKTGEGLGRLREIISEVLLKEVEDTPALLLEDRQKYHFEKIVSSLESALSLWDKDAPDEITAIELHSALDELSEIVGKITNEDVLGRIFSSFCVGK